jgi:hypothetical protein
MRSRIAILTSPKEEPGCPLGSLDPVREGHSGEARGTARQGSHRYMRPKNGGARAVGPAEMGACARSLVPVAGDLASAGLARRMA